MTLKEQYEAARRASSQAFEAAREIKDRNGGLDKFADWPADEQASFKSGMEGFREHHSESEKRKAELKEETERKDEFAGFETEYTEVDPANQLPGGGRRGGGSRDLVPAGYGPPSAEETLALELAHKKAFRRFLVGGKESLSKVESHRYLTRDPFPEDIAELAPRERYALVGSVDNLGGFLVPEVFFDELIKDLAGFAVIRPVAKIRQTNSSSGTFLTVDSGTDPYPSGVAGSYRAEGFVQGGTAIATQDQPTFGRERVPVHMWLPDVIELTTELMEDSAVDLDAEIRELLAETKGLDEDSGFINGTGVGEPEGLLQAGITTIQSGAANGQSYGGIVDLFTGLPAQYRANANWLMNSLTWGLIMQLEDTAGNPIFPTNVPVPILFGKEILFSEFMPDGDTDGNDAIIFGDFRFYGVVDRRGMRIQRLVERYAPNVGILAMARFGGQTLKTPPFRVQNVGA